MNKKQKALNITISIIYTICLVLFAISFSINLPIYFRPFYYALIGPLNIVEELNSYTHGSYTYQDVVDAYNEVLNYCCFFTKFGTGKLAWSEEGMLHFQDCQGLFLLDTIVMLVSMAGIGTTHILKMKKLIIPAKLTHLIAGITSIALPSIIGILASLDFEKAFEIFHKIFFPGKDNWIFYADKDQVILIMPMNFFMGCAIFIGVALIGISIYYIVRGILRINKEKKLKLEVQ